MQFNSLSLINRMQQIPTPARLQHNLNILLILPLWVRLPNMDSSQYTKYSREILLFTDIWKLEKNIDWIPLHRCQIDTFITLAEVFPKSFLIQLKNLHVEDDMLDRHEEEEADASVSITSSDSA